MNFENLRDKNIVLFGKSRALSGDEFEKQLQNHHIHLVDLPSEEVAVIVQGRLINPIDQNTLDKIYAENLAPIIEVDALEAWLCRSIDADTLMMSLKLSGDRERLMGYLQNTHIDHGLFLRLLKLYDWENLGFFESDDNRDITAALISRFYENIERNHNVQYANMGIMHLLNQSSEPSLVETIALLAPLQNALKKGCDNSTLKILHAIAMHPQSSKRVLKQWLKNGHDDMKMLVAMRHDLDLSLQQYLLNLSEKSIEEVLSLNRSIDHSVAMVLLEKFPENIAKHIVLDEMLFESLFEKYALDLAENPTLTLAMQKKLLESATAVQIVLADNSMIDQTIFESLYKSDKTEVLCTLIGNEKMESHLLYELYQREDKVLHVAIAANEKSEVTMLQALSTSSDIEVLRALAKNPSTPIDLLYQFQLDSRLARAVKENPSFGKHIQRDNIGWNV